MPRGIQKHRTAPTSAATAALLDHCERRRALRIVWELRCGPRNFRDLCEACGNISPSVLQSRLHAWRRLGVVENVPRLGYRLTVPGEQFFQVLVRLDQWAERFVPDPSRSNKALDKGATSH